MFCVVSSSYFPPHRCQLYTRGLSFLVWSMHHMWVGGRWGSTHFALLNRMESKVFRLISFPPLTVFCLLSLTTLMLRFQSFVTIFMLTALLEVLNVNTACSHPSSCSFAARHFLLMPIPILSQLLMQKSTSIDSFLLLVNSGTAFK